MKTKEFRVWDSKMNSFWYGNVREIFGHIPNDIPDEHIQQYTGLHDKRWKPIYEGDIIVFTSTVYKGEIKPILITGDVQFTDWMCAYALNIISNDRHDGEKIQLFGGQPQVYEIIGNIFENPELLK